MYIYSYRLEEQQRQTLQSFLSDNVVLKTFSPQEPLVQGTVLVIIADMAAAQEVWKYS